tara:strand:- start:350 stop:2212 length:1863 start_codon:yes stop_codon:yes gene_type:complete
MEFPLYQWTVVKVSNLTGWAIPFAARLVSLGCFYLTLPAIHLLLRRWKFSVESARLCLALILLTPVYVFYSRAVLIESMALLASIWFLWLFDRMCRKPNLWWALAAALTGGIAVLVKVTTFIPWCAAAAIIGFCWSWREWRMGGFRAWSKTVGWGALIASVPGFSILAWLRFADTIKNQSPGGTDLASAALSDVNFGGWQDRVGAESLTSLAREMGKGTLPWWSLVVVAVAGIFMFNRSGRKSVTMVLWFAATLMLFPVLYHRHDYYFYAVAVLPVCALGVILDQWLRHRVMQWVAIIGLVGIVISQAASYHRNYWYLQHLVSNGGTGLTNFMKDMLPAKGAIVVLGQDWIPVIPYYTQRRGIMIRQDIANSTEKLAIHLRNLEGAEISALVVTNPQKRTPGTIAVITQKLGLESAPSVTHSNTDVYLANHLRSPTLIQLKNHMIYSGVEVIGIPDAPPPSPEAEPIIADGLIQAVTEMQALLTFSPVSPAPYQYRCKFGLGASHHDGRTVLGAHPDSDMWIRLPQGASTLSYQIGMDRGTYDAVDDSDGVVFSVQAISSTGLLIDLAEHQLDPAHNPDDRSVGEFEIDLPPGLSEVILSTRPGQTYNFDWAYWQSVAIF